MKTNRSKGTVTLTDTNDTDIPVGTSTSHKDTFDLSTLRIEPEAVTENDPGLVNVLCGRPNKHTFFRINPDPTYQLAVNIFVWAGESSGNKRFDRTTYLVGPTAARELAGQSALRKARLYAAISRQNNIHVFAVKLPTGKFDTWSASLEEAIRIAKEKWIRVESVGNQYQWRPMASNPEPVWPEIPFEEMVRRAFPGELYIDSLKHPIFNKLNGADL